MTDLELTELIRQYEWWQKDPHPKMVAGLTKDQRTAYLDPKNCVLMEGGNQSGKSMTTVLKTVGFALEEIEGCFPNQDVIIWYCTTTYDMFAGPAWNHFKNFLLFPGENVANLPSTRIEDIHWLDKSPEKPSYFCIKRPSGFKAHVHVKSYAQGRKEFQGATLHCVVIDEECPHDLYTEIMARMFASKGARLFVCCTPVEGEEWLDILRTDAEQGNNTSKYRFKTLDNPSVNKEKVEEMRRMYGNMPEELELRLLGIPRIGSSLVYSDKIFTTDHIIEYAKVNLAHYTLHRAIDAGFRHPACVWIAVSPDEKQIIIYRAWKGKDMAIAQAAKEILRLSGSERYGLDLIDPAVCQTNAETGQPEWSVWKANGIHAIPAPDNRVQSGINRVWQLMNERVEIPDTTGTTTIQKPRLRVVKETCSEWLHERTRYRFKDIVREPQRDIVDFRPVKQNDHLMDPTRYLVAAGLRYIAEPRLAPEGSYERQWQDMRKDVAKKHKKTRR